MTEESDLETNARIMALEYLVKRLLWLAATIRADLDDEDEQAVIADLSAYAANAVDDLSTATISPADPAISDHVAALVSENVQRLVDETATLIRKHMND